MHVKCSVGYGCWMQVEELQLLRHQEALSISKVIVIMSACACVRVSVCLCVCQ